MQYTSVQYSLVWCSMVQCSTLEYNAVQCSTVQYSTVQYSSVMYIAVQCSTLQCSIHPFRCGTCLVGHISTLLYFGRQNNIIQCSHVCLIFLAISYFCLNWVGCSKPWISFLHKSGFMNPANFFLQLFTFSHFTQYLIDDKLHSLMHCPKI